MYRPSWNLGTSTSWNPQGLSRHVMGLFYLYLYPTLTRATTSIAWHTARCLPQRPTFNLLCTKVFLGETYKIISLNLRPSFLGTKTLAVFSLTLTHSLSLCLYHSKAVTVSLSWAPQVAEFGTHISGKRKPHDQVRLLFLCPLLWADLKNFATVKLLIAVCLLTHFPEIVSVNL
jgi:hypothetical protein